MFNGVAGGWTVFWMILRRFFVVVSALAHKLETSAGRCSKTLWCAVGHNKKTCPKTAGKQNSGNAMQWCEVYLKMGHPWILWLMLYFSSELDSNWPGIAGSGIVRRANLIIQYKFLSLQKKRYFSRLNPHVSQFLMDKSPPFSIQWNSRAADLRLLWSPGFLTCGSVSGS